MKQTRAYIFLHTEDSLVKKKKWLVQFAWFTHRFILNVFVTNIESITKDNNFFILADDFSGAQ